MRREPVPPRPRDLRKAARNSRASHPVPADTRRLIPTLSLFSGAGGLDLGFLRSGFDIVACVEIEKRYCETLRANVEREVGFGSSTQVHQIDARDFDASAYKDAGIRCVIGGPPCQTFSAAGRRAGGVIGTEDERGQLFQAYCRVLDVIQPEVFVFENVYGLPGANGGGPWKEICDAFESRGYSLRHEVVDAADYGVPQHRERLILVGFRSGDFVFPMPTHGPDALTGHALVSVEAAIEDLQDPKEPYHDDLGGMYGHLLPAVPEGLNYSYFTAEMNHPAPVFAWRSKFHDLLYKVDRNAPCRTLKAQPGKFTGPFHWKNRHFSTEELKRLQSFPDNYILTGQRGSIIEQIGNSVPPLLAEVIATSVREQLLDCSDQLTYPVRPTGFRSTFRQRQRQKTQIFHSKAKAQNATISDTLPRASKAPGSIYHVEADRLFDRTQLVGGRGLSPNALKIQVSESGRHIELVIERIDGLERPRSVVEITGLSKYLPEYDSLKATAKLSDVSEIFHVWAAIEEALVSRSRFFTLIDIYGHYANRGDTVQVTSNWMLGVAPDLGQFLNFSAQTKNCGVFISIENICGELKISRNAIPKLVDQLRAVRFDVRTRVTHPIIKDELILCAYPFPLLSPRALVESRARIIRDTDSEGFSWAEAV